MAAVPPCQRNAPPSSAGSAVRERKGTTTPALDSSSLLACGTWNPHQASRQTPFQQKVQLSANTGPASVALDVTRPAPDPRPTLARPSLTLLPVLDSHTATTAPPMLPVANNNTIRNYNPPGPLCTGQANTYA
ncbi:hypothetical protein EJ04DRAFT_519702 [Polyplosphaeria fusca]|uniref:Uncharacterized protein n=1 Tax=Polyplosphaeria fusca TaxID=682080 RepID=A0A9P4R9H7_9PLEO|nr:hypothetical protein EJ04DRAFT_519702 [Polyplosphaeria fusca]